MSMCESPSYSRSMLWTVLVPLSSFAQEAYPTQKSHAICKAMRCCCCLCCWDWSSIQVMLSASHISWASDADRPAAATIRASTEQLEHLQEQLGATESSCRTSLRLIILIEGTRLTYLDVADCQINHCMTSLTSGKGGHQCHATL